MYLIHMFSVQKIVVVVVFVVYQDLAVTVLAALQLTL